MGRIVNVYWNSIVEPVVLSASTVVIRKNVKRFMGMLCVYVCVATNGRSGSRNVLHK